MKTTASIPDDLFDDAEQLAHRLQISRSRLYARAVAEFVDRHDDGRVKSTMNRVVDEIGEPTDPFIHEAGLDSLQRVEW